MLFLCYLLDDVCDEWLYRPAVGSRWFIDANTDTGGYELGREMSVQLPMTADQAHMMTGAFVRSSWVLLGVSPENIDAWITMSCDRGCACWGGTSTRPRRPICSARAHRWRTRASDFLRDARSIVLARYRALRDPALDAVLERAGIVRFFADHLGQAGTIPVWDTPPRSKHNRPYPPEDALAH